MKILCYGDSNTWGYIPNINGYSKDAIMEKYDDESCWWFPLKKDNEVFVDGLCGRCIAHDNKWLRNRNASQTIEDDLNHYDGLDLVIIQLGTNDCKSEYGDSAFMIAENLKNLINKIQKISGAKILVVSPAQIKENNKITQRYYVGAEEKSFQLDEYYNYLALKNNYGFVSGVDLELGEDGEHLTLNGHLQLSQRVSEVVKNLTYDMTM